MSISIHPSHYVLSKIGFVDLGWIIEAVGYDLPPSQWKLLVHILGLHREANADTPAKHLPFELSRARVSKGLGLCPRVLNTGISRFLSLRIIARASRGRYVLNPRILMTLGSKREAWRLARFRAFDELSKSTTDTQEPGGEA